MTNEQMKASRFLRWAKNRVTLGVIRDALKAGKTVYICTAAKAFAYDSRCIDMFKATYSGVFVQRGKHWDCIDFATIRISK